MIIRRGSTPYIVCKVVDMPFDYDSIKTAWITINQNGKIVLDKVTEDIHINHTNLALPLSQEDTLALTAGISGSIQVRLLNDSDIAYVSQQEFTAVEDVNKDGVIA